MNILILGNGFDLAHDLPTSYLDMFRFFKAVNALYAWPGGPNKFEDFRSHNFPYTDKKYEFTFNYLKDVFEQKFENKKVLDGKNPIEEMHRLLKENVWFKYFKWLIDGNKMRGINWIDFESEICKIVKELDEEQQDLYKGFDVGGFATSSRSANLNQFIHYLCACLQKEKNNTNMMNYRNVLDKSYVDLRDFVRCMELYLLEIVDSADVEIVSPDIKINSFNHVLSFNYTHTYEKLYGLNKSGANRNEMIHYLHGEVEKDTSLGEPNMVLGVDEFYSDERKDTCTNYNIFKKFTQRVLYETGFAYRIWIANIKNQEKQQKVCSGQEMSIKFRNHIYIFGHSLDTTDRDVLEEFLRLPNTQAVVFYYDKQQQVQQIANLVKMLGHDDFIEYINQCPAKIRFKEQAKMETKVDQ